MKRIIFILIAVLSTGCTCLLSQIPPQRIYAGSGCTALIPNYLTKITASDNCEITSLIQTPVAGTMLTATNKVATVVIKATDASGNFKQLSFTVTLLDTIKPTFTIDPSLLAYQMEQINEIYNYGDRLIAYMDQASDNIFPFDSFPGLKESLGDSTYYKKQLLIFSSPGYAMTGKGGRIWTFVDNLDSLFMKK